ncbi:2Fe-2S iron-sulfur cluster-binding protein [Roseivirga spongicola]|uniref:Ferredoxin n=1 Tax=Roseivirga spongicola TaxID=333140 RepID=A0A150XHH2_9BACT|nr:2Fe-2S iron-sulfur cluster-binding protein [Roseivirga spongicola]KYG78158.1 ferredoxin [Roseivirga spongicola]WPZ11899.1 2Fe-2S iron-sulfur cluster-binding protein [Roseivirga spongicola]|tara:strand:+ start:444 stop:767 length:324 start_codon:yes stop_codon:yes gene_type:complete
MPKILIRNLNNTLIDVPSSNDSILKIIQDNQIDWMFACGAKGRCTTCKLVIHKGLEQFGEPSENEQKFLDLGRLKENERLACQNTLQDDIEVSVADTNKFPHITYTD